MKRIGVIFLLVAVLCLGGCNKAQKEKEDVNNWCMEDLKF